MWNTPEEEVTDLVAAGGASGPTRVEVPVGKPEAHELHLCVGMAMRCGRGQWVLGGE